MRAGLAAANVNAPKGSLDGPRQELTIAADDQLESAEEFRPLVLAFKNGAAVRLRDVGHVVDSVENDQLAGWANEQRAVILNVQRQPGANVIAVADRVKELLPELQASLPNGVVVKVLGDRTETVRASITDVEHTLLLTMLLVVAVIYVFLRSWRATAIPGIAVPLSMLGTFGVMQLLGYSLDNLSLMALTISTGFVVDDAIVMIENIARYIEQGEKPFDAALKGAKQIGFTIVSLTVSLIAVLIPLLFMGGVVGRLFRAFAVTLAIAIGMSAILSLTLTPMMCAHLLEPEPPESERNAVHRALEHGFDWLVAVYDRALKVVLAHQTTTLIVTVATLLLTIALALVTPKGFFPQQDTGLILGVTDGAPDVSFTHLSELQQRAAKIVLADPEVESVASFIGADGTNATANTGRLSIQLKAHDTRDNDAEAIIARLRPKLGEIEGLAVYLQSVQDLQLDTRTSRTQFQYTLEDASADELSTWAPKLTEKLSHKPALRDVASDTQGVAPQTTLSIDRDTAARLGVTTQAIDDALYDAFGQRPVSTIFTQLNLYRVILEVDPQKARDPRALDHLYVPSLNGPVQLSAVVSRAQTTSALAIAHEGQFPAVTLSFNLAPGAALGDAVQAIERASSELNAPPGLHGSFRGAAEAFGIALESEPLLILAALITVYIVLGVLYESFIHPVTILSTLPSAGVGALLALLLCRSELSVIALIGIVLLIGIVKKNAIMMIDFAIEAERDHGKPPLEAIHEACLLRFRPILMTTMAALLGGLPLALGTGTGAELRRPLGITIVGGLLLSQALTLFTTPVIYLFMEQLTRKSPEHLDAKRDDTKAEGAEPP